MTEQKKSEKNSPTLLQLVYGFKLCVELIRMTPVIS